MILTVAPVTLTRGHFLPGGTALGRGGRMAESITRAAVVKKIAQQVLKYLPDYYEGSEKFKFIPAQEILQI